MGFLRTVNEASQNLEQGWLFKYLLLIWKVFSCPPQKKHVSKSTWKENKQKIDAKAFKG